MAESDGDASVPIAHFKKRARPNNLIKRKRADSDEEDDAASPEGINTPDEQATPHLSVAEILRQRKLGNFRRRNIAGGARASNTSQTPLASDPVPQKPSKEMSEQDRIQNRFIPATGQTQDIYQKQMDEYIESKMSEYRGYPSKQQLAATATATDPNHSHPPKVSDNLAAYSGKLVEVDLGAGHTFENIARTAAATRKLEAGSSPEVIKSEPKIRIGRNGKPYKVRNRRNSADLARDAAVDSILKEAPVFGFESTPHPGYEDPNYLAAKEKEIKDMANDESLMALFKSRDEDSNTQMRKQEPPAPGKETKARGPKLGGSRNARMKMLEEAAAKK